MRNKKVQNTIFIAVILISAAAIVMSMLGMITIGPFILIAYALLFLSVWEFLSLNMLRSAIRSLYEVPTDNRAEMYRNLLKKTIAVETLIGRDTLVDVYNHVLKLKQVSYSTKASIYDVYENKYITVTYPRVPR